MAIYETKYGSETPYRLVISGPGNISPPPPPPAFILLSDWLFLLNQAKEWTMSAKDAGAIPYLPVPPFTDMVNLNASIDK